MEICSLADLFPLVSDVPKSQGCSGDYPGGQVCGASPLHRAKDGTGWGPGHGGRGQPQPHWPPWRRVGGSLRVAGAVGGGERSQLPAFCKSRSITCNPPSAKDLQRETRVRPWGCGSHSHQLTSPQAQPWASLVKDSLLPTESQAFLRHPQPPCCDPSPQEAHGHPGFHKGPEDTEQRHPQS